MTLRQHLEAQHLVSGYPILPLVSHVFQGKYRAWAKSACIISQLPGDVKKRKIAAEQVTRTLDRDLVEKKKSDRVVPYTDKNFRQAEIEWLAATDQVSSIRLYNSLIDFSVSYRSPYKLRSTRS
jgi:hypothetical protein